MSEVGVAYVRLVPSMRGFSAEASKQLPTGLRGPSESAGRSSGEGFVAGFGSALQRGGRSIASAGDALTKGLTLPVLGLGALAFKASRDFNAGMANIATLIPGNTARVSELKTGIQDLAVEAGKSTSDLSDGMYQVISAFGDSSESLSLLDTNARAATAGLATTTDAINLTSAVTKGYGDTSAEAVTKASDLALLTVRLGQTTFPELASSIGQVIPIAQNLGVTQEELFATMATFTGVTGGASEVATQMRAALQALMAPTADAAKVIKDAGYENGAAAVQALGFEGAVALLTDAAAKSGQPLQKFMGQVEGQTIALGLAGAQSEDYQSKLAQMGDAAGTTDEAFKEATQGVNAQGFAWEQAKARGEVLLQRLGDGLAPALTSVFEAAEPLVAKVTELSTAFSTADPHLQKMIVAGVALVAALGPALSILGRLTTAVGGTVRGIAAFGRGTATVARGGMTAARGLGRLASGFRSAEAAQSAFSGKLGTLGGALRTGVNSIGRFSAAVGRGIGRAVVSFARLTVEAAKTGARLAVSFAQMAARAVAATARVIAQIALQVARWVWLGIQSLINAAKVAAAWLISLGPIAIVGAAVIALVALIIANWDKVVAATKAAFEFVMGIVSGVIDWVRNNWPLLLAILTGPIGLAVLAISRNWQSIKDGAAAVKDWIVGRFNAVVSFFTGIPSRIRSAASGMWDGISNAFKSMVNKIIGWWNGISFTLPTLHLPKVSTPLGDIGGGSFGGQSFSVPQIPYLARGAILRHRPGGVPFVGAEAGEDEAVAPLSRLSDMVAATALDLASAGAARPAGPAHLVIDVTGGPAEMVRLFKKMIRTDGRGDPVAYLTP